MHRGALQPLCNLLCNMVFLRELTTLETAGVITSNVLSSLANGPQLLLRKLQPARNPAAHMVNHALCWCCWHSQYMGLVAD